MWSSISNVTFVELRFTGCKLCDSYAVFLFGIVTSFKINPFFVFMHVSAPFVCEVTSSPFLLDDIWECCHISLIECHCSDIESMGALHWIAWSNHLWYTLLCILIKVEVAVYCVKVLDL